MDNQNSESTLARDKIAQVYLGKWGSEAFQNRSRNRINWFLDQIDGGTVLDIGCSEGILSILLGRKGIDVIGVDINPESIEYANNLLAQEEPTTTGNVTFVCDDFINSDWFGKTYDTVIIGEILEHFSNPEILIDKAISQLKPGATLLVTTPFGYFPDPDHRYTFTLTSFVEYFRKYNFIPVSLTVVDSYIRFAARKSPAKSGQWEAILENLLPLTEQGLQDEQKKFHAQINEMVKVREELYATIKELREKQTSTTNDLKNFNTEIKALHDAKQALETQFQTLQTEHQTLEIQFQALQNNHQELNTANVELKKQHEDYVAQIEELTSALSYQVSCEIAKAFKPLRLTSLLLPVNLGKLVWRWVKKKT